LENQGISPQNQFIITKRDRFVNLSFLFF